MTVYASTGREEVVDGDSLASQVSYDNASSGLAASNVQDALDETVGLVQRRYCDSNLIRSSNAVLSADPVLQVPLAANKKYAIHATILIEVDSGADLKYDWDFTGTTTSFHGQIHWAQVTPGASASTVGVGHDNAIATVRSFSNTGTFTMCMFFHQGIETGASGGTFSFRWAQGTSTGFATTRTRDSWMIVTEC